MTPTRHRLILIGAAILVGGAGVTWAQGKTDEAGGSLAALTAEVRGLRLAVEDSARSQTQTQALGVYLSAEQSRMLQIGPRLEAVRTELRGVTARYNEVAGRVATAQQEAAQAQDPADRAEFASMARMFKTQADQFAAEQQQLRNREAELLQAVQAEEARWAELIGRLEQLIKK